MPERDCTVAPRPSRARAVCAEEELDGGGVELGETLHGEVLLIVVRLDHQTLRALHHVENVGLELFGAVGAHAEVELVGVGGFAKGDGHAEDGVGGRLVDVGEKEPAAETRGSRAARAVGLKRRTGRGRGQAGAGVGRARTTDGSRGLSRGGIVEEDAKKRARADLGGVARADGPADDRGESSGGEREHGDASRDRVRGSRRRVGLDLERHEAPRRAFFTTAPQPSTTRSFSPRRLRGPPACALTASVAFGRVANRADHAQRLSAPVSADSFRDCRDHLPSLQRRAPPRAAPPCPPPPPLSPGARPRSLVLRALLQARRLAVALKPKTNARARSSLVVRADQERLNVVMVGAECRCSGPAVSETTWVPSPRCAIRAFDRDTEPAHRAVYPFTPRPFRPSTVALARSCQLSGTSCLFPGRRAPRPSIIRATVHLPRATVHLQPPPSILNPRVASPLSPSLQALVRRGPRDGGGAHVPPLRRSAARPAATPPSPCAAPTRRCITSRAPRHVDLVFVSHPCFYDVAGQIYSRSTMDVAWRGALLSQAGIEAVWHVPSGVSLRRRIAAVSPTTGTPPPVATRAFYQDHFKLGFARSILVVHSIAHQGEATLRPRGAWVCQFICWGVFLV